MSQKSGFLIVLNGFLIENVGHTLTKNYNGTYWPLLLPAAASVWLLSTQPLALGPKPRFSSSSAPDGSDDDVLSNSK